MQQGPPRDSLWSGVQQPPSSETKCTDEQVSPSSQLTKPLPSSPPAYGRYFLDSQPYQLPYEALRDDNSHIPETGFEHRRSALPTTSGIAPQAVLASEVENTLVPGAEFNSQQARHATHGQHSPETRDPEDHREKVRRSNREVRPLLSCKTHK